MAEIKVLIQGQNIRHDLDKMSMGSSVTLIKKDKTILVDTGQTCSKDTLISELN